VVRTIWKFEVMVNDTVTLDLPVGAKILAIAEQGPGGARNRVGRPSIGDRFYLWAEVEIDIDPEAEPNVETRTFRIYGTGHVMDGVSEESTYVGTVVCAGGDLVWHMYEVLEVSS
jgi:hypothetical protein